MLTYRQLGFSEFWIPKQKRNEYIKSETYDTADSAYLGRFP